MEWWQTLIVATVPALITAVALVIQQHWNRGTELKRLDQLDRDRQHARDMANDERASATEADQRDHDRELQTLWRDERRKAHEAMIAALAEANKLSYALVSTVIMVGITETTSETDRLSLNRFYKAVMDALPSVVLLGSDEAIHTGEEATAEATALIASLLFQSSAHDLRTIENGEARGLRMLRRAQETERAYLAAARRDIGTTK